jgi:hypothetical protein
VLAVVVDDLALPQLVDQRDSHRRRDAEPVGGGRDAAEHRPDEGAVSLLVQPRMEVVRDACEGKPALSAWTAAFTRSLPGCSSKDRK